MTTTAYLHIFNKGEWGDTDTLANLWDGISLPRPTRRQRDMARRKLRDSPYILIGRATGAIEAILAKYEAIPRRVDNRLIETILEVAREARADQWHGDSVLPDKEIRLFLNSHRLKYAVLVQE